MSNIVIKVENLSKLYRIGARQGLYRYHTLRDSLARVFTASFRKVMQGAKSKEQNVNPFHNSTSTLTSTSSRSDVVWALKDVSFEVKRGEVVGIIGRNGAGKTTLLKVLSRITKPTEGYAEIRGRVGSLLEVGTGFHPELTGRENIFLSGAILGMRKVEIKRKFDEIVAFAEIEKFIDTPIKRYSAGMYVRLAFAVAGHLEPEILLVDEVLAVGDISFQKKCLGKIGDVAKEGQTVLFISHQMNQIRRLCGRCMWLDDGQIQKMGQTAEIIGAYETAMSSISFEAAHSSNKNHVTAQFLKWKIVEPRNDQLNILNTMGPVAVKFIVKVNRLVKNGHHGIALYDSSNQLMWATAIYHLQLQPGMCELIYEFTTLPIRPGIYYWLVSLYDEKGLVDIWHGIPEMVVATEPLGHPLDMWQGVLNLPWNFSVRQEQ